MEIITNGIYPGQSIWWVQQYFDRYNITDVAVKTALKEFFFGLRSAGLDKKLVSVGFGKGGLLATNNLLSTAGQYLIISTSNPSVSLHLKMENGAEDYSGNNARGWSGGNYPNNAYDLGSPYGTNPDIRVVGSDGAAHNFAASETDMISLLYNHSTGNLYGVINGVSTAAIPVNPKPSYPSVASIGFSNGYAGVQGRILFAAAGYQMSPTEAIQLQQLANTCIAALP